MTLKAWSIAGVALLVSALAGAAASAAEQVVRFPAGATATTLKGTIRGDADATYLLDVADGQVLQTLLSPSNRSCYYNVFEPGQAEAAHIGSVAGNEFGRSPTKAGTYRLQVYLMRNAARRNESCRYSLSIEVTGKPGGASAGISDRMMQDGCQARVREMYAVASTRIRMGALRQGPDRPSIDGTVNKGAEGVKRFRCLFAPDRQLRDVMAMTPDGE